MGLRAGQKRSKKRSSGAPFERSRQKKRTDRQPPKQRTAVAPIIPIRVQQDFHSQPLTRPKVRAPAVGTTTKNMMRATVTRAYRLILRVFICRLGDCSPLLLYSWHENLALAMPNQTSEKHPTLSAVPPPLFTPYGCIDRRAVRNSLRGLFHVKHPFPTAPEVNRQISTTRSGSS